MNEFKVGPAPSGSAGQGSASSYVTSSTKFPFELINLIRSPPPLNPKPRSQQN